MPQCLEDLISISELNNELFRWVKSWDPIVFKIPLSIKPRLITELRKSSITFGAV